MIDMNKVLVTGVFDLLHEEHILFLKKAKALGDYLVVGIESDVRVKQMKGEGRPVNSQSIRVENLKSLNIIDEVFVLPQEFSKPSDHTTLIKKN
jgi:D-beta-D-heptose 7-phosphate kinase/D-beta-D-heptose 1-phosphate adenosyltransferase